MDIPLKIQSSSIFKSTFSPMCKYSVSPVVFGVSNRCHWELTKNYKATVVERAHRYAKYATMSLGI